MAHSYKGYYIGLSRRRKRIVTAMGRQSYPVHQAYVYLVQLITFTRYPVRDVSAMDEVLRTLGFNTPQYKRADIVG